MILWRTSMRTILWFVVINTVIKIMPLYYLRNEPYRLKDMYFTLVLFALFILWLHVNKQSLVGNAKLLYDSLIYGKDKTPFMGLLRKMENNFRQMNISN